MFKGTICPKAFGFSYAGFALRALRRLPLSLRRAEENIACKQWVAWKFAFLTPYARRTQSGRLRIPCKNNDLFFIRLRFYIRASLGANAPPLILHRGLRPPCVFSSYKGC